MATQARDTSQQNRGKFVTKITNQSLIFLYGILDKNDIKHNVSTWSVKIMFKFKLQDNQWNEHYIPNWNFMLKTDFTRHTSCLLFKIVEGIFVTIEMPQLFDRIESTDGILYPLLD